MIFMQMTLQMMILKVRFRKTPGDVLMKHTRPFRMITLSKDINGQRTSVWNLNGVLGHYTKAPLYFKKSSKFIFINNPT